MELSTDLQDGGGRGKILLSRIQGNLMMVTELVWS